MEHLQLLLVLMCGTTLTLAEPLYFKQNDTILTKPLNAKLTYAPYEETWSQFKKTFNRQYKSVDEEHYRRAVFVKNVKLIEQHNHKFFASQTTYWMGVNQFTDMTVEEYRAYNKLHPKQRANYTDNRLTCSPFQPPLNFQLPASVDWRKKGYVTPIKNQGDCGSCWAFSTTGSIEGQYFRTKGQLISLSEQQLVDCAAAFGPQGCNGGWMDQAFTYINSAGGIMSEQEYPYTARVESQCHFYKPWAVTPVSACYDISKYSETDLQQAVASQGPVSVAIDATHSSFMNYAGGVYYEPECDEDTLDHAVLVVGYGTLDGQDYWLVKNSWGILWGEDGYIMMARNQNNMCGIASAASFPNV